jgi:FKBP-type peptidyl-prolyl cis-trans isomerase SlyD
VSNSISGDKVVTFEYVLTNGDGETLDQSDGDPMLYLHGHGNIVPGLEKALEGRTVGDELEVEVPPAEGYGEREEGSHKRIPKEAFPEDFPFEPGFEFAIEDEKGNFTPLWLIMDEGETVVVDTNHPLAGVTLNFAVSIKEIRDATEGELEHGHPHGPSGHAHH